MSRWTRSPGQAATSLVRAYEDDPGWELVERPTLDLPTDPAVRVVQRETEFADTYVHYSIPLAHDLLDFRCFAEELPDDGWLSIARAVEPIPIRDVYGVPDFHPRVELPDLGIAMEFPAAWSVAGAASNISLIAGGWTKVWARSDRATCTLEDLWAAPRVGDLTAVVDGLLMARKPSLAYETTQVELPSGSIGRIDWDDEKDLPHTVYSFVDDDTWVALRCWAEDPPADRWRSIAETVEFLPAEDN